MTHRHDSNGYIEIVHHFLGVLRPHVYSNHEMCEEPKINILLLLLPLLRRYERGRPTERARTRVVQKVNREEENEEQKRNSQS